jgi:hypothetical protein
MPLPLPYIVEDEPTQGNFDFIKQQFPLSRKNLKVESPTGIGDTGAPVFQNSWVNYDTAAYQVARYWRDPVGIVHIEGLVKDGTIATTIFALPAGYRPAKALIFAVDTNSGHGRLDVTAAGLVIATSGGNTYYSLAGISFKQEQ